MSRFQSFDIARRVFHFYRPITIGAAFGLCLVGCNSEPSLTPTTSRAETKSLAREASETAEQATLPSPTDVVSQFLDRVRRGGQTTDAGQLLTQRAQAELKRIGRSVQPIGTPDAHFDVRQAAAIPDDPSSMLVQSIWIEPGSDGTQSEFEVVWAVHREQAGWRISGLAMELEAGQPPIVIDFENGDEMAKLLASSEQPDANVQQATVPTTDTHQR